MRRRSYRTSRGQRGAGRRWALTAACLGLALYIALALGLGSWAHELLQGFAAREEDELTDGTRPAPQAPEAEVTESVAFPEVALYAVSVGGFADEEEAEYNAELYAARGGAGYLMEEESGGHSVLLAAYDSREAAQSVAQNLQDEENIPASVREIVSPGLEMRLTAPARRIDAVREAFAAWQQALEELTQLWQQVDAGLCTAQSAAERIGEMEEALAAARQAAFAEVKIEGESSALQGLEALLQNWEVDLGEIAADPSEFVLEFSGEIKYTCIKTATEYHAYVEALKGDVK